MRPNSEKKEILHFLKKTLILHSLQGDAVSRTAGLKSIVDMSLDQREGAVTRLHERGMNVAAEAVDVIVLGEVVQAILCDGDTGKPGELLDQVCERVDFELEPSVPGLVEDEICDAGRSLNVVRNDIERGEVSLVSSEKFNKFS